MKIISYFRTAILCFIILIVHGCSEPSDFYLLNHGGVNVDHAEINGNIEVVGSRLLNYRGQWVIFNFWAEWCAPCREEIPELNLLHQNAKNLNLVLIGVSYDPLKNNQIKQIINEWSIQYPVIASDPEPFLPFKLPKKLPGNYILNPNGDLVAKLSGKQTYKSISKLLKRLKKEHRLSQ